MQQDAKQLIRPIDISNGTIAERLIAYAILANIELQQGHTENARKFLKDALDIARRLEKHGATYQATEVSKFAHFTCRIQQEEQIMLLPIIGKSLIIPAINLQAIANQIKPNIPKIVELVDVTIVYFKLRLQTEKLVAVLCKTNTACTNAELVEITRNILESGLPHDFHLFDFLGMAEDYFMLARDMLTKGNKTLALIALRNANKALGTFGDTKSDGTQLKRIQKLKAELAAISKVIE